MTVHPAQEVLIIREARALVLPEAREVPGARDVAGHGIERFLLAAEALAGTGIDQEMIVTVFCEGA